MKAKLEMEESELRSFLKKTPLIKFPNVKARDFAILCLVAMSLLIITAIVFQNTGYNKGKRYGYNDGYVRGEQVCLRNNYAELTLQQAVAYHIKYNLVGIFGWLGIVIGFSWVLHGVGFHIIKR